MLHKVDINKPILFYDGDCGFCNKSVQFVLKHEKDDEIQFAALQSEFANNFLIEKLGKEIDYSTLYFYDDSILYQKSTAFLKILNYLKWYCKLMFVFYIIPRILRNKVYDIIAARRKKIAGEFCLLPTPSQRERFVL